MSKPEIHARSSAKKFGGIADDYIHLHNMMDSSKSVIPSNLHRAWWHNSYGIFLLEKMFGVAVTALNELCKKYNLNDEVKEALLEWKQRCTDHGTAIRNSEGRWVQVRDIGEQHVLEDFHMAWIPTPQDYLEGVPVPLWCNGHPADAPPSFRATMNQENKVISHD